MVKLTVREAGVAGFFYPADEVALEREISLYLESAPDASINKTVRGIVAPHAGYMYSGGVAARAYRQIMDQKYDHIVVIAPSHREAFNYISIFNGIAFKTPLGEIPVDSEIANALAENSSQIKISNAGHAESEHALEVHLPFLQYILGKIKIVPISMGDQSWENIQILSDALHSVLPLEKSLIIASSDLSHFYTYNKAQVLDGIAQSSIEKFTEEQLWDDIIAQKTEMCGYGPVITMMSTMRKFGIEGSKVLLYRNSGDVSGDRNKVVGYLSAVFY